MVEYFSTGLKKVLMFCSKRPMVGERHRHPMTRLGPKELMRHQQRSLVGMKEFGLFVCLFVCLVGWLFVCLFVWLVGWLVGWLVVFLLVVFFGCCCCCCCCRCWFLSLAQLFRIPNAAATIRIPKLEPTRMASWDVTNSNAFFRH